MKYLRSLLFRVLGLNNYLNLLRKGFLTLYKSGQLKNNPKFIWHHFAPKLINEGDTVIDIGANLGYLSYIFSNAVGKNGKVYCIEPILPFRNGLAKTLKNKHNSVILDFALGNENVDKIILGVPEEYRKSGYLQHGLTTVLDGKENKADNIYTFEAKIRKASEVFGDFSKIDYIKCDIEGYEPIVFEDLKEILLYHKPLIQVETWGENFDKTFKIMESISFEPFKITPDWMLVPIHEIPVSEHQNSDTLFVHKDELHKIQHLLKSNIVR